MAEQLVPGPSPLDVEIAIKKLKKYKSQGSNQIPVELIKAGCETLLRSITLQLTFLYFSLQYLCYFPVESHHQHTPEADVSHLISVPPGFPGPS
jgi:hypothetical protein